MVINSQYNKEATVGEWKCFTQANAVMTRVSVYLCRTSFNHIVEVASLNKDGEVVMTKYDEGKEYKPFLSLPYLGWQAVLQCLGAIIPDEVITETSSELKATKYHLEDMRKLLKLTKEVK